MDPRPVVDQTSILSLMGGNLVVFRSIGRRGRANVFTGWLGKTVNLDVRCATDVFRRSVEQ